MMSKWLERVLIALVGLVVGGFAGYKAGQGDALEEIEEQLKPLFQKWGIVDDDAEPTADPSTAN